MNQEANQQLLAIAQRHRRYLENFKKILAPMMLLTTEKIEEFTETNIAFCDAFIMRFCMLQDIMGVKLFDVVIALMGKDPLQMTIIDKTNFLEKLEIIQKAQIWQELRKIRNKLTTNIQMHLYFQQMLLTRHLFKLMTCSKFWT